MRVQLWVRSKFGDSAPLAVEFALWQDSGGLDLTDVFDFVVGNTVNVLVFIIKCWLLVFVMMWVRWTLPRLRIDQVMMTCLKYLLPLSCVWLVGVAFWQLALPSTVLMSLKYLMGLVSLALLVLVTLRILTMNMTPPLGGMPGVWNLSGRPTQQTGTK